MRGIPFEWIEFAHSLLNASGDFSFLSPLGERMTFVLKTQTQVHYQSYWWFV